MRIKLFLVNITVVLFASVFLYSCSKNPTPEPLPLSVKSNFNLLQKDPQFVLYINFKSMNKTAFWKQNISDSLLNSERTFGSLLNTFKTATNASISDGLDELYYSNSWMGENAVVLKGIFDKKKLETYMETDSNFSKTKANDGTTVYLNSDNRLYFFFKDNITICASNYQNVIDDMIAVKDTSNTGLLSNTEMVNAIERIYHKENLWMISKEQMFIRGIFVNFLQSKLESQGLTDGKQPEDSTKIDIDNLYSKMASISFSAKMDNDMNFYIQADFINPESAEYFKNFLSGIISVSKLASTMKEGQKSPSDKILEATKLEIYDKTVMIIMNVNSGNINEFRKGAIINRPE